MKHEEATENLLKDIFKSLREKDKIMDKVLEDRILAIVIKPNKIYKYTENRRIYCMYIKNEKRDTDDNANGQMVMVLKSQQHSKKRPKSVNEPNNSLQLNKLATSESLHEFRSDQSAYDKPSISLVPIKEALQQPHSENADKFTHNVPTRSVSASKSTYTEPIYSTCVNESTYIEPTCFISANERTYTESTYSASASQPTYTGPTNVASASEPTYTEPIYSTYANESTYIEPTCFISANERTYTESRHSASASEPTYTEPTKVASAIEPIYTEPIYTICVINYDRIYDTTIQGSITVEKITYTGFISSESAHTSTYTEHEDFVSLDELLDNASIMSMSDIITDTIHLDNLDDLDDLADFILPKLSPTKIRK